MALKACTRSDAPLTLTDGLVKLPLKAVPVPGAPSVSMKYSAATMLSFPVATSLTLALIIGAALVGLGATVRPDAVGASVSLMNVADTRLLQLPAASSPST